MSSIEIFSLVVFPLMIIAMGWGAAFFAMRTGRGRAPAE